MRRHRILAAIVPNAFITGIFSAGYLISNPVFSVFNYFQSSHSSDANTVQPFARFQNSEKGITNIASTPFSSTLIDASFKADSSETKK